jgi:hypothetical protein
MPLASWWRVLLTFTFRLWTVPISISLSATSVLTMTMRALISQQHDVSIFHTTGSLSALPSRVSLVGLLGFWDVTSCHSSERVQTGPHVVGGCWLFDWQIGPMNSRVYGWCCKMRDTSRKRTGLQLTTTLHYPLSDTNVDLAHTTHCSFKFQIHLHLNTIYCIAYMGIIPGVCCPICTLYTHPLLNILDRL